jgi:hypothetical protein
VRRKRYRSPARRCRRSVRLAEFARVRNTAGMSAAAQLQEDNVIRVDYACGRQGAVFSLHPLGRRELLRRVPDARILSRVCLDRESPSDFKRLATPMLEQVVQLLTGMSLDRLRACGVGSFVLTNARLLHEPVVACLDLEGAPASPSRRSGTRRAARPTATRVQSESPDPART